MGVEEEEMVDLVVMEEEQGMVDLEETTTDPALAKSSPSDVPTLSRPPSLASLPRRRSTTGTSESGKNSDPAVSASSMRPSDLRSARDQDSSDTPQTALSSTSATGTSGLRSSPCTSSPARWPWRCASTTSPSLPATGHSWDPTVRAIRSSRRHTTGYGWRHTTEYSWRHTTDYSWRHTTDYSWQSEILWLDLMKKSVVLQQ